MTLYCDSVHTVDESTSRFKVHFKLCTIVRGPNTIRYLDVSVIQHENFKFTVHGDVKLDALNTYPIPRAPRFNYVESLNMLELKSFSAISSSINWLGITVSVLCSPFWSLFQQIAVRSTADVSCGLSSRLNMLNSLGTVSFHKNGPFLSAFTICIGFSMPSEQLVPANTVLFVRF